MKTIRLAEGIAADYDKDGRLSGLEILDAEKRFGGKDTMRHVEVEGIEFDRPTPIAVALEGRAASSPFFQVQIVANWFFALKRQPPPKQSLLVTVL